MLFTMEQAAAVALAAAARSGSSTDGGRDDAVRTPGALDSAVIQKAQRRLGLSGCRSSSTFLPPWRSDGPRVLHGWSIPCCKPTVQDVTTATMTGEFQLVPIKNRADRTQDALRRNLDATLRLIDQENPAKSELLTALLRAHGNGPRTAVDFPGLERQGYQIFAAWVQSLRSPKNGGEQPRTDLARGATENAEPFASDRGAITSDSRQPAVAELRAGAPRRHQREIRQRRTSYRRHFATAATSTSRITMMTLPTHGN